MKKWYIIQAKFGVWHTIEYKKLILVNFEVKKESCKHDEDWEIFNLKDWIY